MTDSARMVKLTQQQIEFIRTSLDYSARKLRNQPIDPGEDRDAALERWRDFEHLISSIRQALH